MSAALGPGKALSRREAGLNRVPVFAGEPYRKQDAGVEYRAETAFLPCACERCCKQDADMEYRAETAFLQCACEPCCNHGADVEYRAETAYTKQIQGAMSYQKTAIGFSFAVLA